MNTIVNKIRFALLLGFMAFGIAAWSQRANIDKMSISTQMFLDQIENKADYFPQPDQSKLAGPHLTIAEGKEIAPPFCKPDTIDGKVYMSAFVRVNCDEVICELEALGVEIQSKFDGGLMTALIPIERIEEVAALAGVSRINAAMPMNVMTNAARTATNVDDVLTQSADAIAAGLHQKYDGSGVILGIIDTGIDFQHIAFKDKSGNTRIKRAYVYNGSSAQEYSNITSSSPTTDDNSEDHGTHTSSIAGGSSVTVSGSTVTVTDDHASATYGGMAPGADLYLAGIKNLSDTYLSNAVNNMCTYANNQGKPLVVSNSWGSQFGPHDGTGDVADVYNSLFGDSHPNRVALFASSNDAGKGIDGDGGGYHIFGTASSANPLGSILRCHYYSDTDDGYMYAGIISNAWSRAGTTTIKCKIHVLNKSTGAILTSVEVTPTVNGANVSGLNSYYSGTLYAFKDYVSANGKTQILLYAPNGLSTRSANSNYVSDYTLAVEFYPETGSATIDVWGGQRCYFTNYLTTSGHNWQNGSDDMSVSDETTIANIIPVGAYVTKNQITNYNNNTYNYPEYTIGDIAYFSSYATADQSPTGLQYPWITAPGARIVSAVNHRHTTSVDNYSYYGSNYNYDLVVNSSSNPYAAMEGTSMACPTAAGIVALWMQASLDENAQHKNLTVNDVKEIMAETAINDNYTTSGANASHFGNGKINALAGIEYILSINGGRITVDPTELTFGGSDFWTGSSESKTVVVTNTTDEALHLTIAGLNASLSGTPFTVTAITNNGNVAAGGGTVTITITYAPTVPSNNDQATLTIADDVTVALTGSCVQAPEPYDASVSPAEGTLAYGTVTTGTTVTKTITITNEGSQPFTPVVDVDAPFSASYDQTPLAPGESRTITVTFTPTQEGDYSETLTITASESDDISFTYTVTGSGEAPYIAATVSPTALDFMGTVVGNTVQKSVTITNTGTMAFTPVINTDNLPATYSVTLSTPAKGTITGSEVPVGGSLNLNVTYSPTALGTHNGTITIAIGDETFTVYVYGSAVEVTEATVADGTTTNGNVPVYGNYYNRVQTNQMLYPASKFTNSGMNGKTIKKITFYPTNGINFRNGTVTIKLANMPSGTTGYTYNNPTHKDATFTTVKTISMPNTAQTSLSEWVIEDLTGDFTYNGGDLLIEVTTTTGTAGATNFYGEEQPQQSYPSYYSYINNNRTTSRGLRFLPKVTFEWDAEPYVAGTVSPLALTFTDVPINRSEEMTVTVENTGTLNFTPEIDTSNLPAEFTVTGNQFLQPGESVNLTVTYTPTDEGPHSGSFTVTIGDQVFTVTVTGNGIVINNTLMSNEVTVPVYKTAIQVLTPYTLEQLDSDLDHTLIVDVTNSDLNIKVTRDEAITRYDVYHNEVTKESCENWATGGTDNAVSYSAVQNSNDSYVYLPYAKDQDDLTSWVQQPSVTMGSGENEMWVHLNDYVTVHSASTWYVPVVVADGVVTTGNTYGAPIKSSRLGSVTSEVNYDQSAIKTDKATNSQYYYLTAEVVLHCTAPEVDEGADYHYECYKARVWRQWTPYVVGSGAGQLTEILMDEVELDGVEAEVTIGNKDFVNLGTDANPNWSTAEPVCCNVAGTTPLFISRLYFKRVSNNASLRDGGGGGGGGGGGSAPGDGPAPPGNHTGLTNYEIDKTVIGVTYVNTLGMTSDSPFDGFNIVVTRYSDGTSSTVKVIK